MESFDIDSGYRRFRFRIVAKYVCRSLKQLVFPLLDLVDVHVELLGQLHQRLLAPDGGQCHLRLESRAMVPARSSCHGIFLFPASKPKSGKNSTYTGCPIFPSQLSFTVAKIDTKEVSTEAYVV